LWLVMPASRKLLLSFYFSCCY